MSRTAPPHTSRVDRRSFLTAIGAVSAVVVLAACDRRPGAGEPNAPSLAPSELARRLAEVKAGKIVVLHVGPRVLWQRERVPGSRWGGETNTAEGLASFEAAVKALPAEVEVVAYCGCCPVTSCPNVLPARRVLGSRAKASVLDLPTNFRTDWADKGYEIEKG
jgi:thiosulfate/3-mercaptopyruvate sulfurtransferase